MNSYEHQMSPATLLFVEKCVQDNNKEIIKAVHYMCLSGELTGNNYISHTKGL